MKVQGLDYHLNRGLLKEGRDWYTDKAGRRRYIVAQVRKTLAENTTPLLPEEKSSPVPDDSPPDTPDVAGGLTLNDLKRRNLALKNQKEQLEVDRMAGRLIDREDVERALFSFGAEIRTGLTAIPARVIDSILACDTREEAVGILEHAIDEALIALVKIGELKYTNDGAS